MLKRFGWGLLLFCNISPLFAHKEAHKTVSHYVVETMEEESVLEFVMTDDVMTGRLCKMLDIFQTGEEERGCLAFDKVARNQENNYTFALSFEEDHSISLVYCALKISETEGGKGHCFASKGETSLQPAKVYTVAQARAMAKAEL